MPYLKTSASTTHESPGLKPQHKCSTTPGPQLRPTPLLTMSNPDPAPRPKRPAEIFPLSPTDRNNKKPRFDARNPSILAPDAPEEDLILDADVIGKGGRGRGIKRNAVNIDGYESDSEEDSFEARAAERKGQNAGVLGSSREEEEEDMFADLEGGMEGRGEDSGDKVRGGKKKVEFLDAQEVVEGQVMGSRSGGRVEGPLLEGAGGGKDKGKQRETAGEEEEFSSSSGEEEDRDLLPEEMEEDMAAEVGAGGKKRHAPRLDAFNLREEEEEGKYDASGNFVRKATDPDAVNDSWLEGLSKRDMKRAREAQEKREGEQRRKAVEQDAILSSELLGTLIGLLEVGETALEGLQRLNRGKRKVKSAKKKKSRSAMDVDGDGLNGAADDKEDVARKEAVEAITGAADALYSREQHEIYDTEREVLMRQFRRETGEDWQPPSTDSAERRRNGANADVMWEYRWSDARDGTEKHGPYDVATMLAWRDAGYFGEAVEFRRVGDSGWGRTLDV